MKFPKLDVYREGIDETEEEKNKILPFSYFIDEYMKKTLDKGSASSVEHTDAVGMYYTYTSTPVHNPPVPQFGGSTKDWLQPLPEGTTFLCKEAGVDGLQHYNIIYKSPRTTAVLLRGFLLNSNNGEDQYWDSVDFCKNNTLWEILLYGTDYQHKP